MTRPNVIAAARPVHLAPDLADALSRMAEREGLALQPFIHICLQRYINEHAHPDGTPWRAHADHDEAGCPLPPPPEPQADGAA